jgi:hypothetical protein
LCWRAPFGIGETDNVIPDWLLALDMAIDRQFPGGAREQDLSLMSDHGCQPASTAFMQACGTLGIQYAFTSSNNPKGNVDTERVMRTLKEECLWLKEWTYPSELIQALKAWIADYNEHYLHSSLGDKPPNRFEREYHTSYSTQFLKFRQKDSMSGRPLFPSGLPHRPPPSAGEDTGGGEPRADYILPSQPSPTPGGRGRGRDRVLRLASVPQALA